MDVIIIKDVQDTLNNVCNIIQAKKYIQRNPISMIDAQYDYILDEIESYEKIESERNVSVNSDK